MNIGFVLHTKSNNPKTLFARWSYGNAFSSYGIATGSPTEDAYIGNYHILYFMKMESFKMSMTFVIKYLQLEFYI